MRAHLFSDSTRTSLETKLRKGTKALQGQLARPEKREKVRAGRLQNQRQKNGKRVKERG
jgi:hypothetical protein